MHACALCHLLAYPGTDECLMMILWCHHVADQKEPEAAVPVRGTAGADPDAEAAVAAYGGVLVHANDLEYGPTGTSTGNIVRSATADSIACSQVIRQTHVGSYMRVISNDGVQ